MNPGSAHASTRTAFGGPLKDQQAVAHLLAEMATRTEAARLLVYSAAATLDGVIASSIDSHWSWGCLSITMRLT